MGGLSLSPGGRREEGWVWGLPTQEGRGLGILTPSVVSLIPPPSPYDVPNQDPRKESVAPKRTQWGKKGDSSLDVEVRGREGLALGRPCPPLPPLQLHSPGTQNVPGLLSGWVDPTSRLLVEPLTWLLFPAALQSPSPLQQAGLGLLTSVGVGLGPGDAFLSRDPLSPQP